MSGRGAEGDKSAYGLVASAAAALVESSEPYVTVSSIRSLDRVREDRRSHTSFLSEEDAAMVFLSCGIE